jgi:glucose-1-phosphate adenylyltransferase
MRDILAFVLAGGEGKRLMPLTRDRAKPAVPFGGIYRLIDFTLSNCINSGIRRIAVLTQYKSYSLSRHLRMGWNIFHPELDEILYEIPPQKREGASWYLGTSDAIYQNIYAINIFKPQKVLVLAGDHLYKMDYRKMRDFHCSRRATVTIGAIEVPIERASGLGIMQIDQKGKVIGFQEKPEKPHPIPGDPAHALASMGIYLFNTDDLCNMVVWSHVHSEGDDFGKNVIPNIIHKYPVYAFKFVDENKKKAQYWRDVGTIDSYYDASMDLVAVDPLFNLYDRDWPIRTYQGQYPPAKFVFDEHDPQGRLGICVDSIVSGGCIISGGKVQRSIMSPNARVDSHSEVKDSIVMEGVTIGRKCKIRRAIIDKFATIPDGTVIGYDMELDRRRFTVSENGIVVIPRDANLAEYAHIEESPHPLDRIPHGFPVGVSPFAGAGK